MVSVTLSCMELVDAVRKAQRILYQERNEPTVDYHDPVAEWNTGNKPSVSQIQLTKALAARQTYGGPRKALHAERGERPRNVHESPDEYVFKSINFDMLRVLFGQLSGGQRPEFIKRLLECVHSENVSKRLGNDARFPSYQRSMSELPLVAEFCIRTGYLKELLNAVATAEKATTGLVVLFYQLEEIIALNFTVFSEADLEVMVTDLSPFAQTCKKIFGRFTSTPGNRTSQDIHESGLRAREILSSISGINEERQKALHYYLKNQLFQQTPNLEIESDRTKVIGFLDSLGFNPVLTASLDKAESLYKSSADGFDLKSCLGHIRSFYEHMNIDGGQAIAKSANSSVVAEWDPTLTFLKNNGFLTPQQDKFARGIYTLLSDEGVHSLISEQEFARLLRNVVIEYGLMFLIMLEKKGVTLRASNP